MLHFQQSALKIHLTCLPFLHLYLHYACSFQGHDLFLVTSLIFEPHPGNEHLQWQPVNERIVYQYCRVIHCSNDSTTISANNDKEVCWYGSFAFQFLLTTDNQALKANMSD